MAERANQDQDRSQEREETQSIDDQAVPVLERPRAIVGIGASAGGVEALETFFRNMPPDSGLSFVIVMHLDPDRESGLPDVLQRVTEMPVMQIENNTAARSDAVHVIPPNRDLAILRGILILISPVEQRGVRMPIDFFFRQLAEDQDSRAIGIILSGMGHDGALGVQALKEYTGAVMVQDPDTAEFPSMPERAIATGLVDYIAPVEKLPSMLMDYARTIPRVPDYGAIPSKRVEDTLSKVLVLLRYRTGEDFSIYKQERIFRRIERSMRIHHMTNMAEYIRYIQGHPLELDNLAHDLRIRQSQFFREPVFWHTLKEDLVHGLIATVPDGTVLRAWVAGCSTGEEAYSMAIVLREGINTSQRDGMIDFQVFATDTDPDAIEIAREGRYLSSIASDISPERLEKFFVEEGDTFRIHQDIRNSIIFARHDITIDPPFSHLHILNCRLLYVHFITEIQKDLIPLFAYVLNPGGFFLPGTSETIGEDAKVFSVLDKTWHIYQRIAGDIHPTLPFDFPRAFSMHKRP